MGLLKSFLKLCKCKSSCTFNQDLEVDHEIWDKKLSSFSIKRKDITKLLKILQDEKISEKTISKV
jgi:hypothetical protein